MVIDFSLNKLQKINSAIIFRRTAPVHVRTSPARPHFPPVLLCEPFRKWLIILSFPTCLRVSSLPAMNYRWRAWIDSLEKEKKKKIVISFWMLFQILYVKKSFQMQGVLGIHQTENSHQSPVGSTVEGSCRLFVGKLFVLHYHVSDHSVCFHYSCIT